MNLERQPWGYIELGISNRFVHCIIGNTGGTATRAMLDGLGPDVGWLERSAHWPLRYYREKFDIKPPAIGHVRNPFDWYVARYMTSLQYHYWRGSFEDWFYNVAYNWNQWPVPGITKPSGKGAWMWDEMLYFGEEEIGKGIAYDYILRFENLLEDLIHALGQIVPDLITEKRIRETWPKAIELTPKHPYQEGIEQWMRDRMYTPQMVEEILEKDAPIFEQFGYSFKQKYYFGGGSGPSHHGQGIMIGNWEQEKQLSQYWATWVGSKK